jgi:Bacterial self-protective colicin-like immunity
MMKDRPFGRVGEGAALPAFIRGERYLKLLQDYVYDRIGVADLKARYHDQFLHGGEKLDLEEELGRILNDMFSVLERYTTDRKVIAADPEFFVSEKTVREQAVLTLQRLRILNRSPS